MRLRFILALVIFTFLLIAGFGVIPCVSSQKALANQVSQGSDLSENEACKYVPAEPEQSGGVGGSQPALLHDVRNVYILAASSQASKFKEKILSRDNIAKIAFCIINNPLQHYYDKKLFYKIGVHMLQPQEESAVLKLLEDGNLLIRIDLSILDEQKVGFLTNVNVANLQVRYFRRDSHEWDDLTLQCSKPFILPLGADEIQRTITHAMRACIPLSFSRGKY